MDKLDRHLNPSTKRKYSAPILAAMKLAKKKMNRYYSLTDSSTVYRITMVLHPGLKLEYFWQHNWEQGWIDEAEDLTREEYIRTYEDKVESFEDTVEVPDDMQVPYMHNPYCTVHLANLANSLVFVTMTILQIFLLALLKPLQRWVN